MSSLRRLPADQGALQRPAGDSAPESLQAGDSDAALVRWQSARLAAISTGLSRFGHDMRGILAPALLAAERLQAHADPAVRRSADVLTRAVDRVSDSLGENLTALREGLPVAKREQVALAAAVPAACPSGLRLSAAIPEKASVQADPAFMRKAWEAVFAYLKDLGAWQIELTVRDESGRWTISCVHDGRPLAGGDPIRDKSAQGLAVARELMRACGGELLVQGEMELAVVFLR